jgi:hypothetical protein
MFACGVSSRELRSGVARRVSGDAMRAQVSACRFYIDVE